MASICHHGVRAPRACDIGFKVANSIVITRHGDRSPSVNFYESAETKVRAEEDENEWRKVIASEESLIKLRERFPVSRLNKDGSRGEPIDSVAKDAKAFGKLSKLGIKQLFERGVELERRYQGYFGPGRVCAYSTNYCRTQQSAQSLLDGLMHNKHGETTPIHILVPERSQDVANPWDANDVLQNAVHKATAEDEFFERHEREHADIKQTLISELPHYKEDPKRFFWVYACDYFICRETHNLPIPENLKQCRSGTLNHTLKRFLKWYNVPSLCDLAAGDLIRKIKSHMQTNDDSFLTVYSAHDITVLPVLCALEARKALLSPVYEEHWPLYGSIINFEHLISKHDNVGYVRVLFNERELVPPTEFDIFWSSLLVPCP
mmetsp:Transcript_16408/g.28456  ORF Transcript_16408/g.28456 Transcript_16408/m.28456 type:complete len:377 (-) Transcript_16408:231-1361(-)